MGMFDGVHKGHQKIIDFVNKIANKNKLESCLLTFEPHPKFIIEKKSTNFKLLTPLNEKIKKLHSFNLSKLIIQNFNTEIRKLSAEEFIYKVLIKILNIHTLIIGHDHQFGKNREGNFSLLLKLSKKFKFKIIQIPAIQKNKLIISSTKIRNALLQGDLNLANQLLGYYYTISGVVIKGSGTGKKIGFPTANIQTSNEKLIPKKGVYFVEILINSNFKFGIMNIGNRPTFNGKNIQIEVHILNFSKYIYGKKISIQLKKFIRDEIKFDSIEKLIKQIKQDKKYIESYFLF